MSSTQQATFVIDDETELDDVTELKKLGYEQELNRHMNGFSNFAISFAVICILAGGITAFPQALGAGGGASIGIGWVVGALLATVVALGMGQIASSYPTAGGLYHWSSILGGRGFGWTTAWLNLSGLIFMTASVNFGVFDPFFKTLVEPLFGWDIPSPVFIAALTAVEAILIYRFPKATTIITNISGYLILAISIALTAALLIYNKHGLDFSRLYTFTNFTGADGSVWPKTGGVFLPFLSGLLLTVYTIIGFDASAHTSEETRNAARIVPKGIVSSVLWSALFGYILVCSFLLVMPDLTEGVKQGGDFFQALMSTIPSGLRIPLGLGIFVANFMCGLACLTSTSRMMFAFARDGGLPASNFLRTVSVSLKTPVAAVWVSGILSFAATLYGDAFVVLSTGSVVLMYVSYAMPIGAGILAEGKTWKLKGPFNLGYFSKPIAALAVIGSMLLAFVGVQPPNEKVLYLVIAMVVVMALFWFVFGEAKRFKGPPVVRGVE